MKPLKLKPTKLAIAMSLALAGMSGQALAAAPDNPRATVAQIDVYLSGASWPQASLITIAEELFGRNSPTDPSNPCAALDNTTNGPANVNERFCNFHVIYNSVNSGGTIGADYRAYYGTLRQNFPINNRVLLAGTTVLLTNRTLGGMFYGVNPVARSFQIATMPVNADCTFIGGDLDYNYTCPPSGTPGRRPDFGVSDVGPIVLKAPFNKEPGAAAIFNALTSTEVARLSRSGSGKPLVMLQFGLPATNSVPTTFNGKPGLTKAKYAALLSNNTAYWSEIDPAITTGNTQVVICRRSQGTGAQAVYNAYFNKWPCTVGATVPGSNTAPVRMDNSFGITAYNPGESGPITIDPTAGFTVVENPTAADVRDCLWRAETHQDHIFNWTDDSGGIHPVTVQFSLSANPFRAIGILSNDSVEGNNGAGDVSANNGHWTFRELNGVPGANEADLLSGEWDLVSEGTMQYRTDGYINSAGVLVVDNPSTPLVNEGIPPATIDSPATVSEQARRDFIDLFIWYAGHPDYIGDSAATLALPAINYPLMHSNVASWTRYGNLCSTP